MKKLRFCFSSLRLWFLNLKLRHKILYGMVSITTFCVLLLYLLSYHFFYQQNRREALSKSEDSMRMLTSTLSAQFDTLTLNTANALINEPLSTITTNIIYQKASPFMEYYAAADAALSSLRKSNPLVSTAILYGSDGTFFEEVVLGLSKNPAVLFPEDIWQYADITVLPMRMNAMIQRGYTIPVVFPVSSVGYGENSMIRYGDIQGRPKVRFLLLLNADNLQSYFDHFSTLYTHCIYLADKNGYPLSLDSSLYSDMFDSALTEFSASHDVFSNTPLSIHGRQYYVSQTMLNFCDLKVVHVIQKEALSATLNPIRFFMLETWGIGMLLAVLLSFVISNLLTKPISALTDIIAKINHNAYHEKTAFPYQDEVGLLGEQLNSMYDTIQLQIEQIKDEEKKKAQAEIQMLSEQINPHFLYNTLECIHFQVLNQHSQTAAAMLESLGQYLRITLSSGDSQIPFSKEIAHVTAYMQIMNRHSSSGIRFSCQIAPKLESYFILKMLLQPLAENSIKHGFSQNLLNNPLTPPEISISITLTEDAATAKSFIRIEVADNGSGIDLTKAEACLTDELPDGRRHFGLSNIYKRLRAAYGPDCRISFSSVPYFRNCVILTIPYLEASEQGTPSDSPKTPT
ncbi:MAG: histidine kinase [bacterium]|nr:histidine kinase [bacterium]